ncbi:WG repeat protein [Chitinophaga skermanii]|uniref:WG repeat protein n=1 Tax=Chitinophaga skermanii TaxID=331697 RepID=A0A327Q3D1_9BACT|nr:WG repeat-containing protein [Chitinophaga skermanii]RAI97692.1 WG repeat protein [Chitinophaga skermanii]
MKIFLQSLLAITVYIFNSTVSHAQVFNKAPKFGDDLQQVKHYIQQYVKEQNNLISLYGLDLPLYTTGSQLRGGNVVDVWMCYKECWYVFNTSFYDICTHFIFENGKYAYKEETFRNKSEEMLAFSIKSRGYTHKMGDYYFSDTYDYYYKIFTEKEGATWAYHPTDLNKLPADIAATVKKEMEEGRTKANRTNTADLQAKNTEDFQLEPAHYLFINGEDFNEGLALVGVDAYKPVGSRDFGEHKKYGYINENGVFQILPIYAAAYPFKNGFARVRKDLSDDMYFINQSGENIFKSYYNKANDFVEGLAAVMEKDRKYGFIDMNGKRVTQYRYDDVKDFKNGYACVKRGDKWGYINKTGEEVVLPQFEMARDFNEGLAFVTKSGDGKTFHQYIDESFNIVFQLDEESVSNRAQSFVDTEYYDFHNGVVKVLYYNPRQYFAKTETHYYNTKGKQVNTAKGSTAYYGAEVTFVEKEDRGPYSGVLDIKGRWIIKPRFEKIGKFSEGLAKVMLNNNWGYINLKGDVVINKDILQPKGTILHQYPITEAGDFSGGLALVKYNDRYGYMNHDGAWVIAPTYIQACAFKEGIARVRFPGRFEWCYIDKTGKVLRPERR